ncbi:Fhl1p [Sugiyamaella lignohabitans]|uniref:Fhl1p n=1 Tax=Sugiyamaella lignohabitans TaxID=796027 RepID=A0A167CVU3_9ASCO|nr:Fhl1p [Sugiyamaella lignohabitans]ANB12164.1 Fhl1p [Sugiyamaella lignohabitans]
MSTASPGSGSPLRDPSDAVRSMSHTPTGYENIKLEHDAFGMLPPPGAAPDAGSGHESNLTGNNILNQAGSGGSSSSGASNMDIFATPKNDRTLPSSLIASLLDPLTEVRKPTLERSLDGNSMSLNNGLGSTLILPGRASSMPPETPSSIRDREAAGSGAFSTLGSPSSFPLTFASSQAQVKTESGSNTNPNTTSSELSAANAITTGSTIHPTGDNSTNNHNNNELDIDESARVSAYARLDFESFTFYVQTLQVILGRRAENGTGMVDVHLGPAKAISRKHAKIFYNFGTQRFELSVMGRNGAFVGDVFVETGSTVPLSDG